MTVWSQLEEAVEHAGDLTPFQRIAIHLDSRRMYASSVIVRDWIYWDGQVYCVKERRLSAGVGMLYAVDRFDRGRTIVVNAGDLVTVINPALVGEEGRRREGHWR